jgi:hypothetical protein
LKNGKRTRAEQRVALKALNEDVPLYEKVSGVMYKPNAEYRKRAYERFAYGVSEAQQGFYEIQEINGTMNIETARSTNGPQFGITTKWGDLLTQ